MYRAFILLAFLGLIACKDKAVTLPQLPNKESVEATNKAVSTSPEVVEDEAHIVFKFDANANDYAADKAFIATTSEAEKAILAYYSASVNAGCDTEGNCKLTEALGLGKQGSQAHKDLLLKWFKKDKNVEEMTKKNCPITLQGDAKHKFLDNLQLRRNGNEIDVHFLYKFMTSDKEGMQEGEDSFEVDNGVIRPILHKILHEDVPAAMQTQAQTTNVGKGKGKPKKK
jgi:hypothetical protein